MALSRNMSSPKFNFVLLSAILLLLRGFADAEDLRAVLCSPKLPTPRLGISAIYDNDDSIYLFGGFNLYFDHFTEVLKYSISNDTLELVGQLPVKSSAGEAVMNTFGDIFYLPGFNDQNIYQYFPHTQNFTTVGRFEQPNNHFAAVQDANTVLIFGGWDAPNNVTALDLSRMLPENIATIPESYGDHEYPAAIWVEQNGAAYLFSSEYSNFKYTRSTNQFEVMNITIPLSYNFSPVWDGRVAYLLGNNRYERPWRNIVQFDPVTENITLVPVEDFPDTESMAAVYVEKLNRIYMFGGINYSASFFDYQDTIWYIGLNP